MGIKEAAAGIALGKYLSDKAYEHESDVSGVLLAGILLKGNECAVPDSVVDNAYNDIIDKTGDRIINVLELFNKHGLDNLHTKPSGDGRFNIKSKNGTIILSNVSMELIDMFLMVYTGKQKISHDMILEWNKYHPV